MSDKITEIRTEQAPAPIGPYSQAIAAGPFVYCSGQIALDAASGTMVGEGDLTLETEKVLSNLQSVLAAAECGFEDVVKTTIYLLDMADFPTVNEIYGRAFGGGTAPARATVAVSALPKGARVEIDAVALRSGS